MIKSHRQAFLGNQLLLVLCFGVNLAASAQRRQLSECFEATCVACSSSDYRFCYSCATGYLQSFGTCVACIDHCSECWRTALDSCVTCMAGYKLSRDQKTCLADTGPPTSQPISSPAVVHDTGFKSFHWIIVAAGAVYLLCIVAGIFVKCRVHRYCDDQLKEYQHYDNLPSVGMPGGPLPLIPFQGASSQRMKAVPLNGQRFAPALPPGFQ